jgi:UDP-glucose 4-epimerase
MSVIIISGCNGLIGYELAKVLSTMGHTVYGISRTKPDIQNPGFHHVNTDLTVPGFEKKLPEKSDAVYHLAQSEYFREFPEKSQDIFDVNVSSTLRLLEYCRKSGGTNFIYSSSGGIYGTSEKGFDEEDHIAPLGDLGFYLSTKLCSEILVENYSHFFNTIISRLFFVYGQRQRKSMLIPRLVENIRKGNPIILQGNEGLMINPIHVSDAVRALVKSLDIHEHHKINIAGDELLSLKAICEIIGNKLGKRPVFEYQPDIKPKNLFSNNTRMESLLVKPIIQFEEGIQEITHETN